MNYRYHLLQILLNTSSFLLKRQQQFVLKLIVKINTQTQMHKIPVRRQALLPPLEPDSPVPSLAPSLISLVESTLGELSCPHPLP